MLSIDQRSARVHARKYHLRRQYDIPIIFITAHGTETLRERLMAQGAVACLSKPFSDKTRLEAFGAESCSLLRGVHTI